MARHAGDGFLGSQCAVAGNAERADFLERSQGHGALCLQGLRSGNGCDRPPLLRRELDRRAGAAGQGTGRLRPSDGTIRAPLRARQLHGQAARRHDARTRTRPRRAPGAGRGTGRADGVYSADPGRNRVRVRRDADLPRAARPDEGQARAQGHAFPEGRGHDQHGRAPDRLLRVRAQGPHCPQGRRTDG
ncbi:hypothetical protein D9M70_475710 [compost metagenome]